MNILQVITPSKVAGAERTTMSLCEHLALRRHRVVVICKAGQPLIPVMQGVGLDVRGLPIGGKLSPAPALRLAQLARREKTEIINAHLSGAALCVFVMKGLPRQAWERFGWWLLIGLVLYFFYGYSHSKLRGTPPDDHVPGGPSSR